MIRLLPAAIYLALVVYCLIDCVQSDEHRIRNLPKWAWFIVIVMIPIVGAVVWLLGGRPARATANDTTWRSNTAGFPEHERPVRRPKAPDDDPEFLRSLKKSNAEHERLLRKWEEDLKRREEELKAEDEKKKKKPDDS